MVNIEWKCFTLFYFGGIIFNLIYQLFKYLQQLDFLQKKIASFYITNSHLFLENEISKVIIKNPKHINNSTKELVSVYNINLVI